MAEKKLKTGVIGTGMGRYHMEAYSQMPDVELIAVCDLNVPEASLFAEKWGARIVTENYKDLLKIDELDAISIATPNHWHAPMTIDFLNAGKHVLCEKPMATTWQDARAMVDAAKANKRRLMIEQSLRFSKDSHIVKWYIDNNDLGNIYFSRVGWIRRKGMPVLNFDKNGSMGRGEWFIIKKEAGGGSLYDIGVHFIDLAWYFMGKPKPVTVSGVSYLEVAKPELQRKELPQEVDELSSALIRFENGAALECIISWDAHQGSEYKLQVFGDKGGASMNPAKIYRGTPVIETVELEIPTGGLPTIAPYRHFIDCIKDPEMEMIASGEEVVTIIRILNAIQESAEKGREIVLAD
ncbi:Gfo/Idh/MocA family oxidoreductase [candidate division KSB1 bacterium]|nr:Gfo/Idh/MocA family oxidoreductase [candidate division KSB1 bacterium]